MSPRSSRAIERAWSEAGVVILVDLGRRRDQQRNGHRAAPSGRRDKVVVCEAPVVEGAVMAATEASGGAALDSRAPNRRGIVAHRNGLIDAQHLAPCPRHRSPVRPCSPTTLACMRGPPVKLTQLAKRYGASIEFALDAAGPWVDAKSPVKVMRFKAAEGRNAAFSCEAAPMPPWPSQRSSRWSKAASPSKASRPRRGPAR